MHESNSSGPLSDNGNLATPSFTHAQEPAASVATVAAPDAPGKETHGERRATPRRRKQLAALVADIDALAEPRRAWIVDRSLGGLCLAVENPVEPGTLLRVRAAAAPLRMPWVQISVRHCRSKGDIWHLGCEFVRTPSWDVLMQFG